MTQEDLSAPSIASCRYAVLPLATHGQHERYVIYDRKELRIVDGVYTDKSLALDVADSANETNGACWIHNMTPNGLALGLIYPTDNTEGEA